MVSKRSRREFSQRRYSNDRLSPQQQIEQNIQQHHRRDDPYRRAANGSVEISSSNQKQDSSEVVLEAITDFTHKYADATCSTEEQFAYAQEHFHKSHEFQQLTREQQDWFKQNLQKQEQDSSEVVLEAIADFTHKYADTTCSTEEQFAYAQEHFHKSHEDQQHTREEQDWFKQNLQKQEQDSSEVVLEAIADFTHKYADATCSTEEQFAYAQEHFHKSHEFQQLTREQQDWFKQNLQKQEQDSSEVVLEAIADFTHKYADATCS